MTETGSTLPELTRREGLPSVTAPHDVSHSANGAVITGSPRTFKTPSACTKLILTDGSLLIQAAPSPFPIG